MEEVATLPSIVALRLLEELDAAEIPAGSSDVMGSGVSGAIPGLDAPTVTVWVDDPAHVEVARGILERLQSDAGDATEYFKGDAAADQD
jgi:hypothetical protein